MSMTHDQWEHRVVMEMIQEQFGHIIAQILKS